MTPQQQHALAVAGQTLYNYWQVVVGVVGFIGFLIFRTRIGKGTRKFFLALVAAKALKDVNDQLEDRIRTLEQRASGWEERYQDLERRYEAQEDELHRVRADVDEARREGDEARREGKNVEEQRDLLRLDRDALMAYAFLLQNQLHTLGHTPQYPAPALRSAVAVPSANPPAPDSPKA